MGKGEIISESGDGRYTIKLKYGGKQLVQDRLNSLTDRIAFIATQIENLKMEIEELIADMDAQKDSGPGVIPEPGTIWELKKEIEERTKLLEERKKELERRIKGETVKDDPEDDEDPDKEKKDKKKKEDPEDDEEEKGDDEEDPEDPEPDPKDPEPDPEPPDESDPPGPSGTSKLEGTITDS